MMFRDLSDRCWIGCTWKIHGYSDNKSPSPLSRNHVEFCWFHVFVSQFSFVMSLAGMASNIIESGG